MAEGSKKPPKSFREDKGLFRSLLAGGNSLRESFESLKKSQNVARLVEHPERKLLGAVVDLDPQEGQGHWSFFQINPDIFVVVADFTYIDPRLETVAGEGLLELHIKLSGHLNFSAKRNELVEVDGPSLLVLNQPEGVELDEWTDSNREEKSVTIYCRASYLRENLIGSATEIPEALERFIGGDRATINYCQFPITPDVLQAASDLGSADDRFEGHYWLMYVEAKTLELLTIILTAFDKLTDTADVSYSQYELDLFDQAKAIVESEFDPVPTIRQMARRLGLNETKLKSGFKALFGMTIFEYRHKIRMHMAKDLLDDNEIQVSLVAERVGYQHQTTFTTAFKTYFGINPKDYRKLKKVDT